MKELTQGQLKDLTYDECREYAEEIRKFLIDNISHTGGHLASNLGVVEISLALLRVFDAPRDKIIYDVGHQSYVHKILTGRLNRFDKLRAFGGLSGFTKREESEFDPFGAGHSSTSVSAALGFAKSARIKGKDEYSVVVIGDGAFTGGMVYEALNNIDKKDKLIIVLNENEMSISKNVGVVAKNLNRIRSGKKYYKIKRKSIDILYHIPLIGRPVSKLISRFKNFLKRNTVGNFFEEMGLYYLGPANGNSVEVVERLLNEAKAAGVPTIIHLHTKKGLGYSPAEKDPSKFHSVTSIEAEKAKINQVEGTECKSFSEAFGNYIYKAAVEDQRVVAITAAMCEGTGLSDFREMFPERFFDVGIAEEHAVTFAAALSAGGLCPFFAVYSTFFQRGYDQFVHDAALQKLHAVFCLDRAGFVGEDGPTHHGIYDVSMLNPVPNTKIYAPATYSELWRSLNLAKNDGDACVVRYQKGPESEYIRKAFPSADNDVFPAVDNPEVIILTYGRIAENAIKAMLKLKESGITAALYKPFRIKPFSAESILDKFPGGAKLLYIPEEGMKSGSFAESVLASLYEKGLEKKFSKIKIKAIEDIFVPAGTIEELDEYTGLSENKMAADIVSALRS